MSADDLMDARLREAGERWRAATDPDLDAGASAARAELSVHELTTATRPNRRRRTYWTYLASAAAVVLIAGGAAAVIATHTSKNTPAGRATPLVGTHWRLVGIAGPNGRDIPVAGSPSLFIDKGMLSANDGCNSLSGPVKITATKITAKQGLATTAIGCLDKNVTDAATVIDKVLNGATAYRINDGVLTMTLANSGVLTYRPQPAAEISKDPAVLTGSWMLSGFVVQAGASASTTNVFQTTIRFDGSGHVTIAHRCYEDSADVVIGHGTLDITHVTLAWALPCPSTPQQQAEQDQAGLVDDVLTGHSTWFLQQGQLSISKGSTSLAFGRLGHDSTARASSSTSASK